MSAELTPEHLEELIRLLGESREIPGEVRMPREGVNLLLAEVDRLRSALESAESWTKVFPCEITHEQPYDFRQCETHDRTFPLDGECDHAGLSEIDWMEKRQTEQRFRAIKAEAAIERVEAQALYWESLADGDRHYAARIRAALEPQP